MPRIPQYEQQVSPAIPVVPSQPRIGNEGLVAGAIEKGFQAKQEILGTVGKIGDALSDFAVKRQEAEAKKQAADLDTQFRQELQDRLYSPDEEVVKVNGKDVTRPKGIMNRPLSLASGASVEFDDYFRKRSAEYMKQVQDPKAQALLSELMNTNYLRTRDDVLRHESSEGRKDVARGLKANVEQQIKDAANVKDTASLQDAILGAVAVQTSLNEFMGLNPDASKVENQKVVTEMVKSATRSALMADMTGESAKSLLENAREMLPAADYEQISDDIKKSSRKLIEESKQRVKDQNHINGSRLMIAVANGDFTLFNKGEINKMANEGLISNEAATAAIRAIEKPIETAFVEEDDEAFVERVKGIFTSENSQDVEENLIDIMNGFSSGNLSQEKMTLMFQVAKDKGTPAWEQKVIPFRDNFKKIYDWSVESGVAVPYQSQMTQDYLKGIASGKTPAQSAEEAIQRAISAQNDKAEIKPEAKIEDELKFSDKFLTSPVMDTLLSGLQKFSQNRAVKGAMLGQAGMVEGVGGALKTVGLKSIGEAVANEGKKARKTFEIKDPNFMDKLVMGASSSLSFFTPGLAISRGITFLRAAPVVAAALGVGTSSVLESAVEAGGNFEEAKRRGLTDREAKTVANATFWLNMPLLVGTNLAGGLFNPEAVAAKQTVKKLTFDEIVKAFAAKSAQIGRAAGSEAVQEGAQQAAGNVSINDPVTDGVIESALIGGIVGGGLGAVIHAPGVAKEDVPKTEPKVQVTSDTTASIPVNEIAVTKAVVNSALAGVETMENGGTARDVALNTALTANLEILGGFTTAEVKADAAKAIEKAVYEYHLQGGKTAEEAAALARDTAGKATQAIFEKQETSAYRETLIQGLEETIPGWRFTAPASLQREIIGKDQAAGMMKERWAELAGLTGEQEVQDAGTNGEGVATTGEQAQIDTGIFKVNLNDLIIGDVETAHIANVPEEIARNRDIPKEIYIDQKMIDKLAGKHNLQVDENFIDNLNSAELLIFPQDDLNKINFVKDLGNKKFLVVATKRFNGHFVITGFNAARAGYIENIKKKGEVINIAGRPLGSSIETPVKSASQQELSGVGDVTTSPQDNKNIAPPDGGVKQKGDAGTLTPVGTPGGEVKASKLASSVAAQAIHKKLVDELGDLPQYQQVNLEDQAARASELVESDHAKAKRVAMGQETAPEGLLPESVFTAVEDKAINDGDASTLRDLAVTSSLSLEATAMGQRIRALGERSPESPVGAIKEVQTAREQAAIKKTKTKDIRSAQKKIAGDIKESIKKSAPKVSDWESFITELEC